MTSALSDLLINRIKKTGPISVAEFMVEALHHKNIGYYTNSDPFGVAGDFTTAPEISQIFGELIGLWVLNAYRNQAKDDPLCLVELGPGRGTLMSDMVRAISNFANLEKMVELHLVETNPILRKVQDELLANLKPTWHNDLSTLPDQPWFLIANEFLDTLPVHQLIKNKNRWNERLIDYNSADKCFTWTSIPVTVAIVTFYPRGGFCQSN
ncbi:MAG: SAM-dependent methyltransferase [Pseudomonadota bacterium]|nr:SAM-dependent methyltransferase [Pseudomonadota bacterium]